MGLYIDSLMHVLPLGAQEMVDTSANVLFVAFWTGEQGVPIYAQYRRPNGAIRAVQTFKNDFELFDIRDIEVRRVGRVILFENTSISKAAKGRKNTVGVADAAGMKMFEHWARTQSTYGRNADYTGLLLYLLEDFSATRRGVPDFDDTTHILEEDEEDDEG
jgi:hypothetical protein